MTKLTNVKIYVNTYDGKFERASGYGEIAWHSGMLVTKHLGFWQVYDVDTGMVIWAAGHPTKKQAVAKLREIEEDVSIETYSQSVAYWKYKHGEASEHEQSISFALNAGRWA